jgi:predicted membrane protein
LPSNGLIIPLFMLFGLAFCLAVHGTKELLLLIENYVIDIQSAQASNNIFVSVAIVIRLRTQYITICHNIYTLLYHVLYMYDCKYSEYIDNRRPKTNK